MARSQRNRRDRKQQQQQQPAGGGAGSGGKKRPRPSMDLALLAGNDDEDEHIRSDSEDSGDGNHRRGRFDEPSLEDDDDEDDNEPIEAKKLRLAKRYLENIDKKGDDSSASSSSDEEEEGDEEEEVDRIGQKLQRERQKKEGSYERQVAGKVQRFVQSKAEQQQQQQAVAEAAAGTADSNVFGIEYLRGHDLTPTCVSLSGDHRVVSGSKDHSVVLWDLEKQVKVADLCQHWKKDGEAGSKSRRRPSSSNSAFRTAGQVLSVACSDDGRYAAVGRRDASVLIYDIRAKSGGRSNSNLVKTFHGHKGPVTCLAFRSHSLQLFSGSSDRCIRHYNLENGNEMLYLETLYGHQFGVSSVDCYKKERPVSVGDDRTARAWKLSEDTHLIFRGGGKVQAADCVSLVNDDWFLTGHQDGRLSLWMTDKKRAVASVDHAHGISTTAGGGVIGGNGIVSVNCLKMSDVAASGSNDGYLRFWKVQTGRTLSERGLDSLCEIPLRGYVNSIALGPKAKFCVAAVGQEHRLGRWGRIAGAKNRIAILKLRDADLLSKDEDDDDASKGSDVDMQVQVAKAADGKGSSSEKSSSSSSSSSEDSDSD